MRPFATLLAATDSKWSACQNYSNIARLTTAWLMCTHSMKYYGFKMAKDTTRSTLWNITWCLAQYSSFLLDRSIILTIKKDIRVWQ